MENNIVEMSKQLVDILKQIEGVTGVDETVGLVYIVVTKDEVSKHNVSKVGEALAEQALQYKLDLEIVAATQAEIDDAKNKVQKISKKTKSKKAS